MSSRLESRSRPDLVVVGLGPTGLAALYEASTLGLSAVGIDLDRAVGSIRRYLDGLPLVSPSYRFEIGGLPLDCRTPAHPTKEELLHYYARVVRAGRLDARSSQRWVGLETLADGVRVRAETRDGPVSYDANQVLITAWYVRAAVPASSPGVRVLDGLRSPGDVIGDRVVVIGGGISAAEHAGALMLHGHAVTILARGSARPMMKRPSFLRLLEDSGSRIVDRVESLRVGEDGVFFRLESEAREHFLGCDVALFNIGARLDERMMGMLLDAGVIDQRLSEQLASSKSFEAVARQEPWLSEREAEAKAEGGWPDLWRHVFQGVKGVRLAGGALHTGASNSGLFASIRSAELAVRSVAGMGPPEGFVPPLPRALSRFVAETGPRKPELSRWAGLRPRTIATWSRGHISVDPKDERTDEGRARASLQFLTSSRRPSRLEVDLLEACDGRTTIGELVQRGGLSNADEVAQFLEILAGLFRANVLTWLPG
ncbi:MAG: NAD(P)-binding domain-containing protein [Deltaproteobacteria bacterium]|nr:NAD(P)-binding domain-containing protein [Deltaproteobacteria bacterium]